MVGSIWLNWPGMITDYFCWYKFLEQAFIWTHATFCVLSCAGSSQGLGQASWYVSFLYSPCLREEWEIHPCPGTVRCYFDNSISKNSWVQKYPAVVAASSSYCERHILGTGLQLYLLCFSYRTNNNNRYEICIGRSMHLWYIWISAHPNFRNNNLFCPPTVKTWRCCKSSTWSRRGSPSFRKA